MYNTEESEEQKRYYEELRKRQEEHLKRVNDWLNKAISFPIQNFKQPPWKPCLHDSCTSCHGTGIRYDGISCVHMISCDCPKCSPSYLSTSNDNTISYSHHSSFTNDKQ